MKLFGKLGEIYVPKATKNKKKASGNPIQNIKR
jgi:hypothetical protein